MGFHTFSTLVVGIGEAGPEGEDLSSGASAKSSSASEESVSALISVCSVHDGLLCVHPVHELQGLPTRRSFAVVVE